MEIGIDAQEPSVKRPRRMWSRLRDIPRVVLYPTHQRRTVLIALVVGTALFAINYLDEVLTGEPRE